MYDLNTSVWTESSLRYESIYVA